MAEFTIRQSLPDIAPEMGPDEYASIIEQSLSERPSDTLPLFRQVVGSALCLTHTLSISALSSLIQIPERTIVQQLDFLFPVVDTPRTMNQILQSFPTAFRDFMFNSESKYRIKPAAVHESLAIDCFRVMSEHLRLDICGLSSTGIDRSDIPPEQIGNAIPEALAYACINWVVHIRDSGIKQSDDGRTLPFLRTHLLHWLEVLSLTGNATECICMIQALQDALPNNGGEELSAFLQDALQLLYRNMSIIDSNPLQLYSSIMMFAPQENSVAISFEHEIPRWISLRPERHVSEDDSHQIFEGHQDAVYSAVSSPNSSLIVSASEDCTARVWRVSDGKCIHKLVGHQDGIMSVAFTPEGDTVVSGSQDKTVKFWSLKDGKCFRTLRGHNSAVHGIAVSPDSTLLAFSCSIPQESGSGKIWIWSLKTRKYLHQLRGQWGTVNCVDFSPDSTLLVSGADDGVVRVWRVGDGECIYTLKEHEEPVYSALFAPDLSYVASGSTDGTVRVWKFAEESCQHVLDFDVWTTSIHISPDSKFIAGASSSDVIQIWSVDRACCENELIGHNGSINSVAFSSDSKFLVTTSNDLTVRVWSTSRPSLKPVRDTMCDTMFRRLEAMVISPDHSTLASAGLDGAIRLWSFQNGGLIRELRAANSDSLHLEEFRFSPDSKLLLVLGYSSGSVGWLWSIDDGRCIYDFTGDEWTASTAAFMNDSRSIVLGCDDYTVRRWSIEDGFKDDLVGHESAICVVAMSNCSRLLASGDYDDIIRLWDLSKAALLHELKGPEGQITEAVFSSDKQLLAVSYLDKTIRIWETESGRCTKTLVCTDRISSVAFSPDNSLLASTTKDDTVQLWRVEDGICLQTREFPRVGTCSIEFDLSGSRLVFDAGQLSMQDLGVVDPATALHDTGFALSKDTRWITWRGNKILWLPGSFHPACWLIRNSTVAIGCTSGKVIVLRFGDIQV